MSYRVGWALLVIPFIIVVCVVFWKLNLRVQLLELIEQKLDYVLKGIGELQERPGKGSHARTIRSYQANPAPDSNRRRVAWAIYQLVRHDPARLQQLKALVRSR